MAMGDTARWAERKRRRGGGSEGEGL